MSTCVYIESVHPLNAAASRVWEMPNNRRFRVNSQKLRAGFGLSVFSIGGAFDENFGSPRAGNNLNDKRARIDTTLYILI